MRAIKLAWLSLVVVIMTGFSSAGQSYETDTHFYATYAMARYAGINHDVASVIASAAQWPDETDLLGSPMVPDLWIGTKMRRLFHFACPPLAPTESALNAQKLADGSPIAKMILTGLKLVYSDNQPLQDYLENLSANCKTEAENPMAYNLLLQGLQEGNLIRAATAIHTIEDSFAHAGTPSTLGHAAFGHHPDRPFTSPEKYRMMIRAVMVAMVAVRGNLPEIYLDKNYRDSHSREGKPNYQMNSLELANNYLANPAVPHTYRDDTYKDPELVMIALKFFLKKAQKVSTDGAYWILPEFPVENWLNQQTDILAQIKKGPKATCELAGLLPKSFGFKANAPAPFYLDCVLTKVVERLIMAGDYNGLPIVDRYTALSFSETNETVDPIVQNYTKSIDSDRAKLNMLQAQREVAMKIAAKNGKILVEEIPSPLGFDHGDINKAGYQPKIEYLRQEIRSQFDKRSLLAGALLTQQLSDAGSKVNYDKMVYKVISHFTTGYLPKTLNDFNRMEFEDEGELRQFELQLRIRNMRQMIRTVFGDTIRFIENDKHWSYPLTRVAIQNIPLKQDDVLPLPGEIEISNPQNAPTNIKYITFNYNQIDIWVESTLRYMFPLVTADLFPADKCTIVSQITSPVTRAVLKPAVDVFDRDDVIKKFVKVIAEPGTEHCADQPTHALTKIQRIKNVVRDSTVGGAYGPLGTFVGTLYGYFADDAEARRRATLLVNDLVTTNLLPDAKLEKFQSDENQNDEGVRALAATQGFKTFTQWGQLTSDQRQALANSVQRRLIQDDTPYVHPTLDDKEQQ